MVALTLVCEYIYAVFSSLRCFLTLYARPSLPVGPDVAVADRPTYTIHVNDVGYFCRRIPSDRSHDSY